MKTDPTTRRELLRTAGRWACGAGLAGLIARLLGSARSAETPCTGQSICRNCADATDCRRPQARSFRQATREPSN